jgi:hypothetical protein
LTPGSGIRDPGRVESVSIRIRDPGRTTRIIFLELGNHFFGFFGVKIHKFFDADPGSGIGDGDSSDPGSGMEKSRIRDKHSGSATLLLSYQNSVIESGIRDPGSGKTLFWIPDPDLGGQKSTGSRIRICNNDGKITEIVKISQVVNAAVLSDNLIEQR